MKKQLTTEDVMELSETQKSALRALWKPSKYDLAVNIIWTNVEEETYEGIKMMVDDVIIKEINRNKRWEINALPTKVYDYCEMFLKVLPLDEPVAVCDFEMELDAEEVDEDEAEYENENEDQEEELDQETSEDYYVSKETCLPLLSIGQLIEILNEHKNDSELNLVLNPLETICYFNGQEYDGEELCDLLWSVVKILL